MAGGFELESDALDQAGRRLLDLSGDARASAQWRLSESSQYGDTDLAAAGSELARALTAQALCFQLVLEQIGDGLRGSARSYSEADATAAIARAEMHLR